MGSSDGVSFGLPQLYLELADAYKQRFIPQNGQRFMPQIVVLKCSPI